MVQGQQAIGKFRRGGQAGHDLTEIVVFDDVLEHHADGFVVVDKQDIHG